MAVIALAAGIYVVTFTHFRVNHSAQQIGSSLNDKRLTALPSTNTPGEKNRSPDQEIRTLLAEPWTQALLTGYFLTLEAPEFPGAFSALTQQLKRQRSPTYLEFVRVWAMRDPEGAWPVIEPMFDYVAPDGWAQRWEEHVAPPKNPKALLRSPIWPDQMLFDAFGAGLEAAAIPTDQRLKLQLRFTPLYRATFGEDFEVDSDFRQSPLGDKKDYADEYEMAKEIINSPIDGVAELAEKARENGHFIAETIALRRMIEADPSIVQATIERINYETGNLTLKFPDMESQWFHSAAPAVE